MLLCGCSTVDVSAAFTLPLAQGSSPSTHTVSASTYLVRIKVPTWSLWPLCTWQEIKEFEELKWNLNIQVLIQNLIKNPTDINKYKVNSRNSLHYRWNKRWMRWWEGGEAVSLVTYLVMEGTNIFHCSFLLSLNLVFRLKAVWWPASTWLTAMISLLLSDDGTAVMLRLLGFLYSYIRCFGVECQPYTHSHTAAGQRRLSLSTHENTCSCTVGWSQRESRLFVVLPVALVCWVFFAVGTVNVTQQCPTLMKFKSWSKETYSL